MYYNQTLRLLYLTNGLFMFAGIMLTPIFAVFATNLHATVETIGFLGTIFFASKTLGALSTRLITPIKPQNWLSLAYLIKIMACAVLYLATGIPFLYIAQSLLGFAEGIQNPSYRALVATHLDKHHETAEAADWEIILAITGVAGTALGGFLVSRFGFDVLFIVIGLLSMVSLLLSRVIERKK